MVEVETKTIQVWEESNKQVEEFEKEKSGLDKTYSGDMNALKELVEGSKKSYIEGIARELDTVKEELLSKQNDKCINGLEGRLKDIVQFNTNTHEFDSDKDKISNNYIINVTQTFEKRAHSLSSCLEKWFKDYAEINQGETVNWDEVEKKKRTLEGYKSKAIRKERKRNEELDQSIRETELKLRKDIEDAYQKSKGFDDRAKYPLAFPILLNEVSKGSEKEITVTLPLNSCFKEDEAVKKIIDKALSGFEAIPVESVLIQYHINPTFNGETVARLKSNLEESITASGIYLNPRVYLAHAEMNSPSEIVNTILPRTTETAIREKNYGQTVVMTDSKNIEERVGIKFKDPTIIEKFVSFVKDNPELSVTSIFKKFGVDFRKGKRLQSEAIASGLLIEKTVPGYHGKTKTLLYASVENEPVIEKIIGPPKKVYTLKESESLLGMKRGHMWLKIYSNNADPVIKNLTIKEQRGKRAHTYVTQEGLDYMARQMGVTIPNSALESIPQHDINKLSKREVLSLGVEYIRSHYHKHGEVPTSRSWNSKNIGDSWKNYWTNFNKFFKGMMRSQNGREVRMSLEEELALGGFDRKAISKKLKLEYCTVGRDLQELGIIPSSDIKKHYDSLEKIKNNKIHDFNDYPKDDMREKMLSEAITSLPNPEKLNYLGLEGPHFGSYIFLSQICNIDQRKSLISEKDERAYRAMKSIIHSNQKIRGGEIFNGLNLYAGKIDNALNCPAYKNFKFDFINLDFNGYLSKGKIDTLNSLFKNGQVADDAVLFMTLNDSARSNGIVQNGGSSLGENHLNGFVEQYGTSNQGEIVGKIIEDLAFQHGYESQKKFSENYTSRETPMNLISFKLGRKNEL